jgi:23S rRNA pseudouridine1911/1915/1917 synthase
LRNSRDTAYTVPNEEQGKTLSALVRQIVPGVSWSQAKDLCASGRVQVNGQVADDPARRMETGERIAVRPTGDAPRREPSVTDLIVHLDSDIVVTRKPPGLLTVPFERDDRDTLQALARVAVRRIEASQGKAAPPTLRTVQRLDKETSGLVVFARTIQAQRELQRQLGEHTVTRRYLAIAHGAARDAIRGSWGVFRAAKGEAPAEGRQAVTHVRVQERLKGATLVICELETGRQHQIRIHLAEAGHPLVGETVYVRDWENPLLPAPRPMLHAAVLGFEHPRTGKRVRFEEPVPGDFKEVWERLRLKRR